ncbi:UNVERIFIED_CONTAM: hypothetical protein HDU68_010887 [Siphonaria sp. JEL0065]|nr:hypothetical protein HDU68_010887 [Siphonaria sp. JEL0065]
MTTNDYNKNYAMVQDIIKPSPPVYETPVNHLTRDAVDSVIERPGTPPISGYTQYERRYDDDDDDQSLNEQEEEREEDDAYYEQLSPTKSDLSSVATTNSSSSNKTYSSHEAVFGSESNRKKKVTYDRSVRVEPKPNTNPHHNHAPQQNTTRPPMLNYGHGNTHPTSDEHFMKSFNAKVPQSQMYPHTEDRSSRIREYENSIKSQTQKQINNHYHNQQQQQKPGPTKTPFKAMWDAQSDAYKASSSFRTEYQREYHSFGDKSLKINGNRSFNQHVSAKPTALSPQPPLGSNLKNVNAPANQKFQQQQQQQQHSTNEDEDEDQESSAVFSKKGQTTLVSSGKPPFHKRNEQDYYNKRDIQLPIVSPPERVPIDYDEDLGQYEKREKKIETMKMGSRVLQYHADPPSTWNLANDLLIRAQRRQAYNEAHPTHGYY